MHIYSDDEQLSFLVLGGDDELEIVQPDSGIHYFIPSTQVEYLLTKWTEVRLLSPYVGRGVGGEGGLNQLIAVTPRAV